MKEGLDRAGDFIFNDHLQKIIFLDIIGEGQIPQIIPSLTRAELVNDQDIRDASAV